MDEDVAITDKNKKDYFSRPRTVLMSGDVEEKNSRYHAGLVATSLDSGSKKRTKIEVIMDGTIKSCSVCHEQLQGGFSRKYCNRCQDPTEREYRRRKFNKGETKK